MSEPTSRRFRVPLNRCVVTAEMRRTLPYTAGQNPQQEFDQLKRVRETVVFRLERQQDLIGKIKRGKFKVSLGKVPIELVLALAENDLKILEKTFHTFEKRRSELKRKIHEDAK